MNDLSTIIHALDIQQGGPKAVVCGNDVEHGRLAVHGSGRGLICGRCTFAVQVDGTMAAEAIAGSR